MSDQASRTSQSQKSDPLGGLNHLTFLIPLRIDTEDRLWNLTTVLRFLTSKLPGAEVILIEQDTESKLGQLARQFPNTSHRLHAEGGAFRKAKCVNEGALQTTRRFICMYDTDILINPAAIHAALAAMADGKWKMVLPFNRIFLDVYGSLRSCFGNSLDITGFDEVQKMADMRGVADLTTRYVEGGIFVADRETFLAEGGLNQKWSPMVGRTQRCSSAFPSSDIRYFIYLPTT